MNHCAFCFHKNSCPEASFRQWCEKYRDTDDHEDWRARALIAEAKLRELAEAAEWRDECNALYSEMCQDWLCDDEAPESPDWMESIFDILEAAESAYQAALKAAKEGR